MSTQRKTIMQDVINGLLVVLVPMLLGYLLKVKNKTISSKLIKL
ncbi:Uncharacterised protein [Rodentibacter pneumotropicus]|uniref:Uncharacterized protein n=1 Tax=Rodentibacter pneumotropicus TaxID=758 RepID=A0A3S4TVQ0_9PAST|nr:Uncharacterised protein [Rodentibacter pneumotropicus]